MSGSAATVKIFVKSARGLPEKRNISLGATSKRYYIKAKLGADLPSVRTKIATGAEPVFNELITLECKDTSTAILTLTLWDDLPVILGGSSRTSQHGRATIPIQSLIDKETSDMPATSSPLGKHKSNIAIPETWYKLNRKDGTEAEGELLVEVQVQPLGGEASTEASRNFDMKHAASAKYVRNHEDMCNAYSHVDDIELMQQINDMLAKDVELVGVTGATKRGKEAVFKHIRDSSKRLHFYETHGIKAQVEKDNNVTTEAVIKLNYAIIPLNISEKVTWNKEGKAVKILRTRFGGALDTGKVGAAYGLYGLQSIGGLLTRPIFEAYKLVDNKAEAEVINKKYGMGKKIGAGAFGTVKIAMDNKDGGLRAIKIVNKPADNNEETMKELRQEMELMNKIGSHQHVLRLYEYSEDESHVYFVLEYCSGGDMMDRLMSRSPTLFGEAETQKWFKEILLGLQHMHLQGVVHRDLKPENILYKTKDEDSSLVLIDFGLSATLQDDFSLRDTCGTPIYMAPEVILSGEKKKYHEKTGIATTLITTYGVQCDTWSAGVVLYVMLSGHFPFYGVSEEDMPAMFADICSARYDMPKELFGKKSREVVDLIKRMLTANPQKRITIAQALEHPWFRLSLPPEPINKKSAEPVLVKSASSKKSKLMEISSSTHEDVSRTRKEKYTLDETEKMMSAITVD